MPTTAPERSFISIRYYLAPFYEHNLGIEDYRKMAKILARLKAKFILSINDHKQTRETFKAFPISPVTLTYTASKGQACTGREFLIRNF